MVQSMGGLHRKIQVVQKLQDVVDTMKTMAATNMSLYEKTDQSLKAYTQIIENGFCAILQHYQPQAVIRSINKCPAGIGVVVFGSDQGMVGRFNDVLAKIILENLQLFCGEIYTWCVGERLAQKLQNEVKIQKIERVPDSPRSIAALIGRILPEIVERQESGKLGKLLIFYNKANQNMSYEPIVQQLLPVDMNWLLHLSKQPWPTKAIPQIISNDESAVAYFMREYLFITMCWACSRSIISENTSRLAVMQRASKNIEELLEELTRNYYSERQNQIDAEMFDVILGYDASKSDHK